MLREGVGFKKVILVCGKTETNRHQHSDACYEERKVLICGQLELHTHGPECYDEWGNWICGLLELKEHVHGNGCFTQFPYRFLT